MCFVVNELTDWNASDLFNYKNTSFIKHLGYYQYFASFMITCGFVRRYDDYREVLGFEL